MTKSIAPQFVNFYKEQKARKRDRKESFGGHEKDEKKTNAPRDDGVDCYDDRYQKGIRRLDYGAKDNSSSSLFAEFALLAPKNRNGTDKKKKIFFHVWKFGKKFEKLRKIW